jgi:hypothetical protein
MNIKELYEKLETGEITLDSNGHRLDSIERIKDSIKRDIEHNEEMLEKYTKVCSGELTVKEAFDDKEKEEKDAEHYNSMKTFYKGFLERKIIPVSEMEEFKFWDTRLRIMSDGGNCFKCCKRITLILLDKNTIGYAQYNVDPNPEGETWRERVANGAKDRHTVADRCQFADGIPYGTGTIKIDSKMVLANFFEAGDHQPPELLDCKEKDEYADEYSLNNQLGRLNIQKYKASNNIAYGQMGNMSLGVYLSRNKKKVVLANPYWEDRHSDLHYETPKDQRPVAHAEKYIKQHGLEYIGDICLDVWRWEATDYEYVKQFNPSCLEDNCDYHILDVEKGDWEFTHYFDSKGRSKENSYKDDEWEIYAELNLKT